MPFAESAEQGPLAKITGLRSLAKPRTVCIPVTAADLDLLPARIAELETEQKSIQAKLADGSLFSKDYGQAMQLQQRDTVIEGELLEALMRWEELSS